MKDTQKPASTTTGRASEGFTDEERAAMKEHGQELKAAARRGPRAGKADGESDVLAKIAETREPDRALGERLHAIIKPARRPSRREPGTGIPPTPRTARSSASSSLRRSSKPGTRRSASTTRRTSTTAPYGRPPTL